MQSLVLAAAVLALVATPGAAEPAAPRPPRNVTFLSTSDCHYKAVQHKQHNEADRETIDEMNAIAARHWPEKLGSGPIDRPRGVVVLGDVIDDGDKMADGRNLSAEQYKAFLADFGLDGADARLKYPVYEGWGNHDGPPEGAERFGFSFQSQLKKRNALRREKGWLAGLSENGLHYSWDWDDVHFVQLNLYPADRQRAAVKYSPKWHDPQQSLAFLKHDLAKCVGSSGRPVVLMSHCGFDTDWWYPDDWKDLYEAAKPYNVVLYLYGHTGTGLRDWAPEGESQRWTCVNDGNTTAGFFVVQIAGDCLRLAYRLKEGVKITKNPDGTVRRDWDGAWGWRWPLERRIAGVPSAKRLAGGTESTVADSPRIPSARPATRGRE